MEKIFFEAGQEVKELTNGALLLGYFDGVHKGHQKLIEKAKESSSLTGVLLFDANLANLIPGSGKKVKELTSLEEKIELFESFGIDRAYIIHTDLAFLGLRKKDFIEKVLLKINPAKIVVGDDYTFGYKKEGDVSSLREYFDVISCSLLLDEYGKISTRNIVSFIEEGKIKEANSELGYMYSLSGKVIHGFENGRKISYPTANVEIDDSYAIPSVGVYSGYTEIDNKKYPSIINIGNNPTVGKLNKNILESHILNFDADIYNKDIRVYFLDWIRGEKKFSSLDELKSQLDKDSEYFDK